MIVLMAGLPGTGKSTLARALNVSGGVVFDKDEIRRVLFPPAFIEYSAAQDDLCQSLMLDAAAYLLARHPGLRVFLDGRTFSRAYQIQNAIARAEQLPTPWRILMCVCSASASKPPVPPTPPKTATSIYTASCKPSSNPSQRRTWSSIPAARSTIASPPPRLT